MYRHSEKMILFVKNRDFLTIEYDVFDQTPPAVTVRNLILLRKMKISPESHQNTCIFTCLEALYIIVVFIDKMKRVPAHVGNPLFRALISNRNTPPPR